MSQITFHKDHIHIQRVSHENIKELIEILNEVK